MARAALFCLLAIFCFAFFIPLMSPHDCNAICLEMKNAAPCAKFWFGTDELGRDLFTRIAYGARISLFIGCSAALIDMVIGILWGSLSALLGGKVDHILMRVCDILHSIPHLLVVILLTTVRESGMISILMAMTITGWIQMARICRGQILQLKQMDYILAARAIGAGKMRILFVHLLPNAMAPLLATLTLTVPIAVFTEAFLSFIGLGIQAPLPSLGVMLSDGAAAMRYYPWRMIFPGLTISLIMLCFNLLGNHLRDHLDPRSCR